MPRIVDVARRAGVSTATVSRALNGKPVRPELLAAVTAAAAELGYTPDRTARSLRRRSSDVVALVLPDVENPFFTAVARGVEDVAQAHGVSVVLCNTDDDAAKEARYLAVAQDENMAGVVIAAASGRPALAPLLARDRAVVAVDRAVADDVDLVTFDNVALGRAATQGLLARGFRRIACVTGPAATSTAVERAQGWRDALADAGLPAPDGLLVRSDFRVAGAHDAAVALLDREPRPDAVVATNNLGGVGVLRALAERGVPVAASARAAGEVSAGAAEGAGSGDVAGCGVAIVGDLPFATSSTDGVLLVPLDPRDLGAAAARMLMERIRGLDVPARRVVQRVAAPA
ncbi:LacI family transcriptional regulator [Cellulomonas iranensis]|uniref:LacI family DNA-binding transcriptional regulator n=1 Tax=Cellulomonas iranensis TaxID=76862 RepID=UPI001CF506B5|nr:LacI family DNA-binding transcriptional regulator [Cellulomonas iranensis]UCN14385.1 LacI family transcriptional regulator [Cellulomonas iranensis]